MTKSYDVHPFSRILLSISLLLMVLPPRAISARDGDAAGITSLTRAFSGLPHRIAYVPPYTIAALDSGLEVYDAQSPGNTLVIGQINLPSPAYDLVVVNSLVYLACGESGLAIVDISDPATPTLIAVLANPPGYETEARGIAVVDGLALLAESSPLGTSNFGLRIVDVVNPGAPVEVSHTPLANGALSVAVAIGGQTAWVGIGARLGLPSGVAVVDISDPAAPVEVTGSFVDTGLVVTRIVTDGTVAFAGVGDHLAGSLTALDVSSPTAPRVLSRLSLDNSVEDISLVAGLAYLAARESGIRVIDISDPAALRELGDLPLDEVAVTVASRGDITYVGTRSSNGTGGLAIVNTTSPTAMSVMGRYGQSEATAVASTPGVAFLLRREALYTFSVDETHSPEWLGQFGRDDADYSSLSISGTIAAVGDGRRVHLVDVADPANPTELGSAQITFGTVVRVSLDNNTLCVVNGRGIDLFDISSPSAPARLSSLVVGSGVAAAIARVGMYGLLVGGEELNVIDLAVPTAPVAVGRLGFVGDQLRGIDVDESGSLAVVVGLRHMYVLDLTNPAAPTLDAMVPDRMGYDVRVANGKAILAAGRDGLRVFDLSDPTNPIETEFYDTSGEAVSVSVSGDLIQLATMAAQHWTMACPTCGSCVDAWPTVAWNSVRAVAQTIGLTVSWSLSSGVGDFNLHRTADKTALPVLYSDMGAMVQSASTLSVVDNYEPASGEVAFYRVFGRGLCDGLSQGP